MQDLHTTLQTLYTATRVPLMLTDSTGMRTAAWPDFPAGYVRSRYIQLLLTDFLLQKRDTAHPLILYVEPGYFVGVVQLDADEFCLLGPVSPTPHSHTEALRFCAEAVSAQSLQDFCNMLLTTPLVDLRNL